MRAVVEPAVNVLSVFVRKPVAIVMVPAVQVVVAILVAVTNKSAMTFLIL